LSSFEGFPVLEISSRIRMVDPNAELVINKPFKIK